MYMCNTLLKIYMYMLISEYSIVFKINYFVLIVGTRISDLHSCIVSSCLRLLTILVFHVARERQLFLPLFRRGESDAVAVAH